MNESPWFRRLLILLGVGMLVWAVLAWALSYG